MTPNQPISYIAPAIQHLRDDAHRESSPPPDEIARLAYELWEKDDHPTSTPEAYWLEAERRLRRKSGSMSR
jgi:hypothetical protein